MRKQALFGVVQGEYKDLRIKSAKFMVENGFAGFGIGFFGEEQDMLNIIEWVIHCCQRTSLYILLIGAIEDIFNCVERELTCLIA